MKCTQGLIIEPLVHWKSAPNEQGLKRKEIANSKIMENISIIAPAVRQIMYSERIYSERAAWIFYDEEIAFHETENKAALVSSEGNINVKTGPFAIEPW